MKKPRFCLFLAIFLLNFTVFGSFEAFSKDDEEYSIEEVAVNVESNSPANARVAAFNSARRNAFLTLLSRLEVNKNFANKVSDEEVADCVRLEQVFNEKFYGNSYSGTFKIVFAKDFIDHLFTSKNLEKSASAISKEPSYLIIPVEVLQKRNLIWESGNQFRNSIDEALKKDSLRGFKLPQADIENLTILNSDNAKNIDVSGVSGFFTKYGVELVYITFFSYDDEAKKATVLIRGFERGNQFQYRLSFLNSANFNRQSLLDKVSVKVVDYLANLKIEDIRAQKLLTESVKFYVPIKKMGDWLEVQSKIENSGLVSLMNVEAVSRDYVRLSVSYNKSQEIVGAFAKIGLKLVSKGDDFYVVLFD